MPGPAAGDFVLLVDPGLILEPYFYRPARHISLGDLLQTGGEVFLNDANASGFWA
jgi:hypothetical protein